MNLDQLNSVKDSIQKLKAINISDVVTNYIRASDVGDEGDLRDVIQLEDIPYYFGRMLKQLESEVQGNDFPFYPDIQEIDEGASSLTNNLNDLNEYITHNDILSAIPCLKELIYYQMVNGFWSKSDQESNNDKVSKEVLKLKSAAEFLLDLAKKTYDEIKVKYKELEVTKQEFDKLKKEKNDEINLIIKRADDSVKLSQNKVEDINALLNNATRNDEHINGLVELSKSKQLDIEKITVDLTSEHKRQLKEIDESKAKLDEYNLEINSNRQNFTNLYEEIESKKSFFDERNQILTDLIGREVSVSLSKSFEERVTKLGTSVSLWRWIVLAVAITNLSVIIFFYYYNPPTDIWQRITGSALKAVPALFLLYYAISQYNKERNFQETYAFKSAVALTLMAYRDQLASEEKKEDFIIEAVRNIYIPPEINQSKADSKDVSSILDMLKSIKDLLPDTVKK